MDMEFTWAWIALALAMFPASMGVVNLFLVRPARGTPPEGALVSILIPARNEAAKYRRLPRCRARLPRRGGGGGGDG